MKCKAKFIFEINSNNKTVIEKLDTNIKWCIANEATKDVTVFVTTYYEKGAKHYAVNLSGDNLGAIVDFANFIETEVQKFQRPN